MQRRDALRSGVALFCGASLGGCLDALESDSAWRDLVVDRPEAVYVPPEIDGMTALGTASAGGYALALSAMRPHRFWTVTGTETNQIAMREAHSMHLMASAWALDSERYVPSAVAVSIDRDGEQLLDRTLWPMLSQRMGPHHGDNVALPEPGTYTATVRVVPADVRHDPSADGLEPSTHEIEFEYDPATIEALERTILDEDRRGEPGAIEPMGRDHGGHRGGEGHPPVPTAPPAEAVPGVLGVGRVGECPVVVAVDGRYLAASVRTPYNGFPVPRASLSARIDRADVTETVGLVGTFDPDLGYHYGVSVEPPAPGEKVTIAVETPPQVARHEGYETAFFDRGRFSLRVPR